MPPYTIEIPRAEGNLSVDLPNGSVLFVLGANGTGKSALVQSLYAAHRTSARRIAAHRQTWFASDAIQLSPQQKLQIEKLIENSDTQAESRWKEERAEARTSIAIYDVLNSENLQARQIAAAVRDTDIQKAQALSAEDSPIEAINRLLHLSNIPVTISIHENDRVLAKKGDSEEYSIAELSDGERNALLIAANVLTAPEGALLLIDEPERHLHRSIVSPLLQHLLAERDDCSFVVSTHEVSFPFDLEDSRTLLIRGCEFHSKRPRLWDADLVDSDLDIDDQLRMDILGSRRRIIFVEGVSASLDKPLYSLLFPGMSVIPKESCKSVEIAVRGINHSTDLHWLEAYGVVDGDARVEGDRQALRQDGIIPLNMYSIESLYYDQDLIEAVAKAIASVDGGDADERISKAISSAVDAVARHSERLAQRRCENRVREEYFNQIPGKGALKEKSMYRVEVDIGKMVEGEDESIQRALSDRDYQTLVKRYPLRETPAFDEIAKNIGLQNRQQYHRSVLKLVSEDPNVQGMLREKLQELCEVIGVEVRPAEQNHAADARTSRG
jgi:ABC-type cobalamin/Fe3+-siderophores transport system ATPase subunit